ncbi:hypothetical protein, partial [Ruminococcus sp.]
MTALEDVLHGITPPPASLVPLSTRHALRVPFQGRLMHKLANAIQNKVTHLHKKTLENQHYQYRQGQL